VCSAVLCCAVPPDWYSSQPTSQPTRQPAIYMGCSFCTFYTDPEVQERLEELRRLGITQYIINYMHAKFSYYDVNHTGLLDWSEILAILYEDDGPFMRRLLRKFMAKGSLHHGRMTFMGFLLGMWNILTLNLIYLPQFVFELYDENNEGFINGETVKVMVSETYHHTLSKKEQPLPITGDLMEIIKFTSFCHEHSFIVKPVFDIITRLKSKLIGTPFWELETRKRLEIFENRYLTLDQALHELRILIEYTRVRSDGTEENSSSKKASNSPATGRRESKSHDHGEPPHHHNAQVPASSPQHPKPNLHTAHSPSTEHLSPSPHIISSSGAADSENHHKHHHHPKHIGHAAHEPSHLTPQETAKLQEVRYILLTLTLTLILNLAIY